MVAKSKRTFSLSLLMFGVVSICLIFAAYSFAIPFIVPLNPGAIGVVSTVLASCLLVVYALFFKYEGRVITVFLAVSLLALLAIFNDRFLPSINEQYEIYELVSDTNAEIERVLNSDSQYEDVNYATTYSKCIELELFGSVESIEVFKSLKDDLFLECDLDPRFLSWDIYVNNSKKRIVGADTKLEFK